jgi:hypothetical protein
VTFVIVSCPHSRLAPLDARRDDDVGGRGPLAKRSCPLGSWTYGFEAMVERQKPADVWKPSAASRRSAEFSKPACVPCDSDGVDSIATA